MDLEGRALQFPLQRQAKWLYGSNSYDCFEAKKPRKSLCIKCRSVFRRRLAPARVISTNHLHLPCRHAPFQAAIEKRRTQLVRKAPRQPSKIHKSPEKFSTIHPRAFKNIGNFSIGIAVAISDARGKPLLISTR
jgi:uncharacterized C2H2 Zn-finger protein